MPHAHGRGATGQRRPRKPAGSATPPRVPPLAVHASPSPAPHSRRHAARGPSPRLPSPGTCVYRSAVSFGDLRAHLLSSPDDPPLSGGPQRVSPSARPTVAAKFWQLREKLLQTSAHARVQPLGKQTARHTAAGPFGEGALDPAPPDRVPSGAPPAPRRRCTGALMAPRPRRRPVTSALRTLAVVLMGDGGGLLLF